MTTHFHLDEPIATDEGIAYGIIADADEPTIITDPDYAWPDDAGTLQYRIEACKDMRRDPLGFAGFILRDAATSIAEGDTYGEASSAMDRRPVAEWTTSEEGL